jgi:CBS-domain-containing membrane protein
MQFTDTLHPPGGTALIAVIGVDQIHQLGYLCVFFLVATGAVLMLFVASLVNYIAIPKEPSI